MPTPEQMAILQRLKARKDSGENIDFSGYQGGGQAVAEAPQQPQGPQTITDLLRKINPILGNTIGGMASAGQQAFGGGKGAAPETALEQAIKYNQYQTGTPDFKMREAQTRADIEFQKGMDLERAKREEERRQYQEALSNENGSQNPPYSVQPAQPIQTQVSEITNPQIMGNSGVPKFISVNEPGTREYDPKVGQFVTKPGKPSLQKNPDYQGAMTGNAGQYGGALQGLKAIKDIQNILGLQRDETGKVVFSDPQKARANILGSKAAGYQMKLPLGLGSLVPGAESLISGGVQSFAGEEARNLDLAYQTLAEDVLRARTGAAAPEPEQVRELARTFARYQDTPENIYKRLEQNGFFLETSANAMKPEGQVKQPQIRLSPQAAKAKGAVAMDSDTGEYVDAQGNIIS